jgi:hypothetical protein
VLPKVEREMRGIHGFFFSKNLPREHGKEIIPYKGYR